MDEKNLLESGNGLRTVLQQTFPGGSLRPADTAGVFGWDDHFRLLTV